jgi:hypothetical protein
MISQPRPHAALPACPLSFGSSSLSGRSPAALAPRTRRIICRQANLISARLAASADTSTSNARRPGRSPRAVAKRCPVTLALATHSLAVSPDTCVLRRVLVVPSTVCLRGFLGVGRGWQVVMILAPHHEPPVLSQSSGHWLMTRGDDD